MVGEEDVGAAAEREDVGGRFCIEDDFAWHLIAAVCVGRFSTSGEQVCVDIQAPMAPGKLEATETVLQAIDVTVVDCVHAAIFERGYESSDGKKGKIESRRDAEISAGTETSVYAGCADEDRWVEASSGGGRSLREGGGRSSGKDAEWKQEES